MLFDFIAEKGSQRHLKDRDAATRHLIRKRATQAAAVTKRRERQNEQPNLEKSDFKPAKSERAVRDLDVTYSKPAILDCLLPNAAPSCPEYMTSPSLAPPISQPTFIHAAQFVYHLSTWEAQSVLANSSCQVLEASLQQRNKHRKMARLTQSSFLNTALKHCGQSKTLDTAIACLTARAQSVLTCESRTPSVTPSPLYGRALLLLKSDIEQSPKSRSNTIETLLAILVLALYELLDFSDQHAWILHSQGAAIVLQSLDPLNVVDEPFYILLIVTAPILIAEALHSANDCFLSQPDWQNALRRAMTWTNEPYNDRGEVFITLMKLIAKVPTLFNRVTNAVRDSEAKTDSALQVDLEELRSNLAVWRTKWNSILNTPCSTAIFEDRRLQYFGYALVYSAIVNRLILAIGRIDNISLEIAANTYAIRMVGLKDVTTLSRQDANFRLGYLVAVAQTIVDTSCKWIHELLSLTMEAAIAPKTFDDWCKRLGRPVI